MALSPGSTLGPYEIRSQFGQGGMGVVYLANDPRLDRQVAIKVLPPDLTRDTTAKQRFLQEAKAASALDHPNICTIHEINETPDGQLYLVMAHYDGETLKERIARGPVALDDAIDIATQVGQGHRRPTGIVVLDQVSASCCHPTSCTEPSASVLRARTDALRCRRRPRWPSNPHPSPAHPCRLSACVPPAPQSLVPLSWGQRVTRSANTPRAWVGRVQTLFRLLPASYDAQ